MRKLSTRKLHKLFELLERAAANDQIVVPIAYKNGVLVDSVRYIAWNNYNTVIQIETTNFAYEVNIRSQL